MNSELLKELKSLKKKMGWCLIIMWSSLIYLFYADFEKIQEWLSVFIATVLCSIVYLILTYWTRKEQNL